MTGDVDPAENGEAAANRLWADIGQSLALSLRNAELCDQLRAEELGLPTVKRRPQLRVIRGGRDG